MVFGTREIIAHNERMDAVPGMFKEVVGLFNNVDDLQNAIRELEGTAFSRGDISVMGKREDLQNVFGSKTVPPELAMDNADTPRQAPSRPEEQNIGRSAMIGVPAYIGAMAMALSAGAVTFPAIIGAAALGATGGGAIGAILAKLLGDRYSRHIEEQIERGGLLLWVRTPDKDREDTAQRIMIACGGYNVHVHEIV
jgi:hypothetical protein